jgi:hypothetical protein
MTTRTLEYNSDKQGAVYAIAGKVQIPCPADDTWAAFVEFYGEDIIQQYAEDAFIIEAQRVCRSYRKLKNNPMTASQVAEKMANWKPKLKHAVVRESAETKAQKAEIANMLEGGLDMETLKAAIAMARAAQSGATVQID